jgi:hypothetical protein
MKENHYYAMALEELHILEPEQQIDRSYELNLAGFNRVRQRYFKSFQRRNENYLELLKNGSKLFSFNLPDELSEVFNRKEEGFIFWLFESTLLHESEKIIYDSGTSEVRAIHEEIKKYFNKWIVTTEPHQKKFIASQIVRNPRDNNSLSFLDFVYQALVLVYDKSYKNYSNAVEKLDEARQVIISQVSDAEIRNQLLYLVHLYSGFASINLGNYNEASSELSSALDNKSSGVTAKFYYAYLSAMQNHQDFSKALLKEIYDFDINRLTYAIENSNLPMLNFFLNHPVFPEIFSLSEFALLTDYIEHELIEPNLDRKQTIESFKDRLTKLKRLNFEEFYEAETLNNIAFIDSVSDYYSKTQTVFVSLIASKINDKFHESLDMMKVKMEEKFYENYHRVIRIYEKSIEDSENLSTQFKEEVENIRENIKQKLTKSIQQVEEYVKDALWEIEERKKNISLQNKFDPAVSFRSSMSYNVIISIIVFVIGGAAGYFNNSNYFDSDFYLMLGKIIIAGIKWSALTFVIGFFISALISGLVVVDRSNEKQKLDRQKNELQKQKELSLNLIRKEAEVKQKSLSESFIDRIESHKRKIEDLLKEKERQEPILKAEAEVKMAPFVEKLQGIYLS